MLKRRFSKLLESLQPIFAHISDWNVAAFVIMNGQLSKASEHSYIQVKYGIVNHVRHIGSVRSVYMVNLVCSRKSLPKDSSASCKIKLTFFFAAAAGFGRSCFVLLIPTNPWHLCSLVSLDCIICCGLLAIWILRRHPKSKYYADRGVPTEEVLIEDYLKQQILDTSKIGRMKDSNCHPETCGAIYSIITLFFLKINYFLQKIFPNGPVEDSRLTAGS